MDQKKLEKLIDEFDKYYSQYVDAQYNETNVRNEFVNPFFEILGWDVLNKKGLPQYLREVKHEASVMVNEDGINKKKKPDYAFHLGSEVCYFLETKKPYVNIMENKDSAFQTRRYGWNGNLKTSVLTNFADLIIYDTTIRPHEDDDVTTAMIAHFHYTEYIDRFEQIARLLSYESVITGEFFSNFESINETLKKEPFDKYFLNQISCWRMDLGNDIFKNNPSIDEEGLNIFVQRVINRIVFLRICEDRNLEEYESLKNIQSYDELKQIFLTADKKYNSGLFNLIDEQKIIISDKTLLNIFKTLYYPNSCYEFSVVDPYIIGQIYELFLEEKLVILDNEIKMQKKPEIIDVQGVVNTPKNITDIIVKKTLEELYESCNYSQWNQYRIADICCGSGNFLLSVFEYIINQYIDYNVMKNKQYALENGIIIPAGEEVYTLSYETKVQILKNNIFGVDIDSLAVEVSKFSLLVKLMEDSSREEMESYAKQKKCKLLPNLDNNIKTGNSLLDTKYLKFNPLLFDDDQLVKNLKIFDWEREFGIRKFDAIVGNPPYIRVQNLVHYSSNEYDYYKSDESEYETAQGKLLNKYYLFLERGLQLLSSQGKLGYIIPHKFMTIKTGTEIRRLLANKKCVSQIVHFGTEQIFEGRSTYTCLLFLDGKSRKTFNIGFVNNLAQYYGTKNVDFKEYPIEYLGEAPWNFLSNDIIEILDSISNKCQPLEEYVNVFVGLQTSADAIYVITPDNVSEKTVTFTDKEGVTQTIEKGILKPCIYDITLEKYAKINANAMIIFPYYEVDGKLRLYSLDEMEKKFPRTKAYLERYKPELEKRNMTGKTDNNWYKFGRGQSIKRFSKGNHLIWPVLSTQGNYIYDDSTICFTGGGNGPFYGMEAKVSTQESLYYIQALLNHWLLERIVKSKASTFRGDYYSHGKQFIVRLPIYKIDFDNPSDVKIHDTIVKLVKEIMQLKEKRDIQNTKEQKKAFERLIDVKEEEIEKIITQLYGAEKIKEIYDEE